jgi:hypothetical protein
MECMMDVFTYVIVLLASMVMLLAAVGTLMVIVLAHRLRPHSSHSSAVLLLLPHKILDPTKMSEAGLAHLPTLAWWIRATVLSWLGVSLIAASLWYFGPG